MDTAGRRPLVVIENPRTDVVQDQADAIAAVGYDVSVCAGPDAHSCPLLRGERCDLVDMADAVVYDLDLDLADHRVCSRPFGPNTPSCPSSWRRAATRHGPTPPTSP